MADSDYPPFNVPTTPTPITKPEGIWESYFGEKQEMQYYINDIRQRHAAALMQDGHNYFYCHRKTSGTLCPFFDSNLGQCQKPTDPNTFCLNTSYIGGYDTPLLIKVALPTATKQLVSNQQGLMTAQDMRPWTTWSPVIANRDMFVNAQTGDRYEALNVTESGPWRGLIVCQFMDFRLLQNGVDFGWQFKVPLIGQSGFANS